MVIDVVILSYGFTRELRELTNNCVSSLLASEPNKNIEFNIMILESYATLYPYQYVSTKTIYPDAPFGIHRYYNIGVNSSSAPFICLCNNDLLFHPNWAIEILNCFTETPDLYSASPICSRWHPEYGFQINSGVWFGHEMSEEISGWCVVVKRGLFKLIGRLDENLEHWYTDNDYGNTLKVLGIKHALVTSAVVDHLAQKTTAKLSQERVYELTWKQKLYYDKKWRYRIGDNYGKF